MCVYVCMHMCVWWAESGRATWLKITLVIFAQVACYYVHSISYLQRDLPALTNNPQNISVRKGHLLSSSTQKGTIKRLTEVCKLVTGQKLKSIVLDPKFFSNPLPSPPYLFFFKKNLLFTLGIILIYYVLTNLAGPGDWEDEGDLD